MRNVLEFLNNMAKVVSGLHLFEEFLVFLVSLPVHTHQPVKFIHYFGFNLKHNSSYTNRCHRNHTECYFTSSSYLI